MKAALASTAADDRHGYLNDQVSHKTPVQSDMKCATASSETFNK